MPRTASSNKNQETTVDAVIATINTEVKEQNTNADAMPEKVVERVVEVREAKQPLSPDTQIPCVSMVKKGRLVYESKRTRGYKITWNNYMDIQSVDLSELVAMKASDLAFFSKNYIVIADSYERKDEVLKYLHVERYYDNTPDPHTLSTLFNVNVTEMVNRIKGMPVSVQESVAKAAQKAIADGTLDSLKRIAALEEVLGCKLM